MQRNKIDLSKRFRSEICSFEVAKKAREAGMTCANQFYSYDENGNLGDGAWMEDEEGIKKKFPQLEGRFKAPLMYPAIMFPFAVGMLEDTDVEDWSKIDFYEYNGKYFLKHDSEMYQSENIVDVLVLFWIKNKKEEKADDKMIPPMSN